MEFACGSAAIALAVLDRALWRARLDELPRAPSELVTFVRQYVHRTLSETSGPRLADALCNDLMATLDDAGPNSRPQASVRGGIGRPLAVALVDADCVRRTALARAFVREGWNARVIDSEGGVERLSHEDEWVHVALVHATHPAARAILERLVWKHPGLVAIVRSADDAKGRALVGGLLLESVDVLSAERGVDELVNAIRSAAPWYGSG